MKQIIKYTFLLLLATLIWSCESENLQPVTPTNEKIDKGHDSPDKITFTFTEAEQKGNVFVKRAGAKKQIITFTETSDTGLKAQGDSIYWKVGKYYHLDINYYNIKGNLMNNEFLTKEMAPIHQHFFRIAGKSVTEMNKILTYTYQDTDPTDKDMGQPYVGIRKRTWDTNNPSGIDPIGLKGVFLVQKECANLELKITLAHFLGADRGFNKLKEGEPRKYNEYPKAGFFASDLNVKIPVYITQDN